MKTWVGTGVVFGPCVQVMGKMGSQRGTAGEVLLSDEHHWDAWFVPRDTGLHQVREIGEVLSDNCPVFLDGHGVEGFVGSLGQVPLDDAGRVMAQRDQFLRQSGRKHLVDEPPHVAASRGQELLAQVDDTTSGLGGLLIELNEPVDLIGMNGVEVSC